MDEANGLIKATKEKAVGVKCTLVYTADDRLKVLADKNVADLKKPLEGRFKPQTAVLCMLETRMDKTVFAFTNYGNCHKIDIYAPELYGKLTDEGMSLAALSPETEEGERIIAFFEVKEKMPYGALIFFTKKGMIKKTDWSEYDQKKNVFVAVKLNEDDEVIAVEEDTGEEDTIIIVTEQGVCLNAKKDDIPTQGRVATGVRGIQLREGDKVILMSQINGEGEIIVATSEGKFKKVISSQIDVTGRYKKGSYIVGLPEGATVICASYVTNPYALAVVQKGNVVSELSSEDIPIAMQSAKARKLARYEEGTVNKVLPLFYKEEK